MFTGIPLHLKNYKRLSKRSEHHIHWICSCNPMILKHLSASTITITSTSNAAFISNGFTADYGGLFYISLSEVTFIGLQFVGGFATERGGCVYTEYSTVGFENSEFTSCSTHGANNVGIIVSLNHLRMV